MQGDGKWSRGGAEVGEGYIGLNLGIAGGIGGGSWREMRH